MLSKKSASEIKQTVEAVLQPVTSTVYLMHTLATAANDFLVASTPGRFVKRTVSEVKAILGLGTAAYTAVTDYVTHDLATAANDFLVASGAGVFVKKTLAEVKTILGLGTAAYTAATDYAVAAKGVTNGDSHDHVGGDGAQIAYSGLSGLPTLLGYTLTVMATASPAGVPADSKNYYYGSCPQPMDEYATYHRIYIPKAGTIKAAYIYWNCAGGGGTTEEISTYIRLNNTSDTLIAAVGNNLSSKIFSNTGLSIAVAQGDYIEIKSVTPAWVTNPSDVRIGGVIYIE